MKPSLMVRVDADPRMGTGHFMRSLALAQAWHDAGGTTEWITRCEPPALLDRVKREGATVHSVGNQPFSSQIALLKTPPPAWWKEKGIPRCYRAATTE